jgi:WD40 repeat protein
MNKRSSSGGRRGGPSSADRKRQALPPPSTQEHDASSIPRLPPHLIAGLILPFVQNRPTWNSVCWANKELMEEGKKIRPPWPNAIHNVGGGEVLDVAFSPCGSFLACAMEHEFRVWDRKTGDRLTGEQTHGGVYCLQYSLQYLATGTEDSIRLWPYTSKPRVAQTSLSDTRDQGPIVLLGPTRWLGVKALVFSPTDSNILASLARGGEIKLWDVSGRVCIQAFDSRAFNTRCATILFSPGDDIQCYVLGAQGSTHHMIRVARKKKGMGYDASTIRIDNTLDDNELEEENIDFGHKILDTLLSGDLTAEPRFTALSPCGTWFAALCLVEEEHEIEWELAMFHLRTMAKIRSVTLFGDWLEFGRIAVSPDGKKLVTTNRRGIARLFECDDLSIQKYDPKHTKGDWMEAIEECSVFRDSEMEESMPIAFDSTSQFFAVGCIEGRVEILTV